MSAAPSVPERRLIGTQSSRDAIYHALRPLVGNGRTHTTEDISLALGSVGYSVKPETVGSWVAGSEEKRRVPPAEVLLILCQYLGKAFTTKVLSAIGQGAYDLNPVKAAPASVVATLALTTHEFAARGVDHVFDNPELGELEPIADSAIAVLEPFSSKRAC